MSILYNHLLFDNNYIKNNSNTKLIINFIKEIRIYRNTSKLTLNDFIKEYKNPLYLILYNKTDILATSRLIINKKYAYINLVYTNKLYRNKKLCFNNIKLLIDLTINLKKNMIYCLNVFKDNIAAIKCYSSCGFKIVSIDSNHPYYIKNTFYMEFIK